jgi:negative regulator of sigma E activity
MTELDETTCEQLSAWMDGALSAEEARFLERRLAHDPALRAKWERMQLASSCLRGHEVRPMPLLAERVARELDATPAPARRPLLGWAIAASVALLALTAVPRWMSPVEPAPVASAPVVVPAPAAPTASVEVRSLAPNPGSADFVAGASPPAPAIASATPDAAPAIAAAPVAASAPLSPADFPLADTARSTAWPRAGLPGADPAMEGYLVRHNEMAGADALGGFVPYLDVVAAGEQEAVPAGAAEASGDAPVRGNDRQ